MAKSMYQTDIIYVNGVKMTQKEYKAMAKSKRGGNTVKHRKNREKTEIREISESVGTLVRDSGPIKSLAAYYDNGYRQWGNVARCIIETPGIYCPFISFRTKTREMLRIIDEISKMGKRDDKSVFTYIRTLSWKLEDVKNEMELLYRGVHNSGVIDRLGDKECINANGKRLGLKVLMERTILSINKMSDTIKRLNGIADKGVDALDYAIDGKGHMFRIRR